MMLALKTCPTIAETGSALREPGARYLGGGTLVVRAANEGDLSFSTFVRSTDPALSAITIADGRVTLGASVTMSAVERHPGLAVIAKAARVVGGPAVRNMATVGGNLFAASPYGDFAVALLALGAIVHTSEGDLGIDAFLAGREGRLVVSVSFDMPDAGAFRFVKVSRVKPKGVSVLSIAVLTQTQDGRVGEARIALGCMGDRPVRAKAAEIAMVGAALTEEGIAPAAAVVGQGTKPLTDAIASAWYRGEVLPVHFRRLLLE